MSVKLLTEHHLEFLSLKGGCTGSPESTLVKIPHCWKSCVMAQMYSCSFKLCMSSFDFVLVSLSLGSMSWSEFYDYCDPGQRHLRFRYTHLGCNWYLCVHLTFEIQKGPSVLT